MKEFKGTKGDWKVKTDPDYSDTYYLKGDLSPTFGESFYNAKLISAAPDLLEALQKFMSLHTDEMEGNPPSKDQWYEAYSNGERAIQKALEE